MNNQVRKVPPLAAVLLFFCAAQAIAAPISQGVKLEMKIDSVREIFLQGTPDRYTYSVAFDDGTHKDYTPVAFSAFLVEHVQPPTWIERLCNISSMWGVLWVGVGLLGQILFTGRMVVQWLTSERRKRSVIPVSFWWMSLIGGALLLTYFIWRRDVVGVLGQTIGIVVYSRNLILIHRRARILCGSERSVESIHSNCPPSGQVMKPVA